MSVTVIGLDGTELSADAAAALAQARIAVGGRRNLAAVSLPRRCTRIELGPLEPALAALDVAEEPAVVLASGDPGFFGIVRALREHGIVPRVLPALSSVQRAFAAIGRPWDDVVVVSAHGRALRPALNVCRSRDAVAVLTAPGAGPAELAAGLHGWDRTLVVAEDLGGAAERISTVTLAEAAAGTWAEPNVVLCLRSLEHLPPMGWIAGGPRAAVTPVREPEQDVGPEVLASVLSYLDPAAGQLVWVGGAQASAVVAAACARRGAAVLTVRNADVPAMAQPDSVFLGGETDIILLVACLRAAPRRAVLLQPGGQCSAAEETLRANGFRTSTRRVTVTEIDVGDDTEAAAGDSVVLLVATRLNQVAGDQDPAVLPHSKHT